jgi:hypothetical protein
MHVLSFLKLADFTAFPVKLSIFCFTSLSLVVKYSLLALLALFFVHFHSSVPGHHKAIRCKVLCCLFDTYCASIVFIHVCGLLSY